MLPKINSMLLNQTSCARNPAASINPFGPADKHTGLEQLALWISYTSVKKNKYYDFRVITLGPILHRGK